MSRPSEPPWIPWKEFQCISLSNLPLPPLSPLTPSKEGWVEQDHSTILEAKNKISAFESQEEWEIRKKITNPYEAIFSSTDDTSFPCIAIAQPLSRSYFKMVEMLQFIQFWTKDIHSSEFVSAHVCEGPGGFIQCLLQQAKQRRVNVKGILAMTLKPTKSHIPGWRRSIGFLRKNPEILLEYGKDETGDILQPQNQEVFLQRVKTLSPLGAAIFTADGGFDFSIDYSKQEQMAFPLLLSSFSMGLSCLRPGGTLLIKLFDMYSKATQDVFLGTSVFFDRFVLYKPATSRPCNSERYFLAQGYKGSAAASEWIQHLQKAQTIQSPLTSLIEGRWPPQVEEAVQEQIAWQESLQIQSIEDTLQLEKASLESRLELSLTLSRMWCDTFQIPRQN